MLVLTVIKLEAHWTPAMDCFYGAEATAKTTNLLKMQLKCVSSG